MNVAGDVLLDQYAKGRRLWPFFDDIERELGLPPFLLWAVGSKETGLRAEYADGKVHNDGHGWGLFGADDRWNDLDLPAFASDPHAQARLAGATLSANRQRHGDWLGAVNAYGPAAGRPAYGHDVLERAAYLAVHTAHTGGSPMKFVSRAEWGADDPSGVTPAPGMTRGVGVHWLGGGRGPTQHSQCAAKMREVQAFHTGPQRGWADFAYNDGACCHGYVFEGRGPRVRNAANGGGTRGGFDANAGWASILYLAGTDGPELTPEGKDAINDSAVRLGVADGEWLGHADFLSTECPGDDAYAWVHAGHPRGTGTLPGPTDPQPEPDLEVATMFIFDASPARGGGIYYTDGATWKRGVPNGNSLLFYATGKVPHVGVLPDDVFDAIPFASAGLNELAGDVAAALAGPLAVAMEQSDFETGDPGCAGART